MLVVDDSYQITYLPKVELNFHQKSKGCKCTDGTNIIVIQHRNYVIRSNFSSQSSQPATIQHMHPVLEYALTISSPHHTCKFKMTPQRLARFVFNYVRRTSSVTTMLHNLHRPTLETKSLHAKILSLIAYQNCVPLLVVMISGYLAGIKNQNLFQLFFPFNHEMPYLLCKRLYLFKSLQS